jgi:spore coat polysaccharide biosynthesis protein SpsF
MKTAPLAIVQARVSSARLPRKVLKNIIDMPMLAHQVERLRRAETIDELVIATSDHQEDNAIEDLCREIGVGCFRGSLDDVLKRFYQCARQASPEHVIRLTGDCPLADPAIIDRVVRFHLEGDYDYTSNALKPTWPDGMDVEVIRFVCLAAANEEAELPSEREHVTSFIYKRPERYRIGSVTQENNLSSLRLTVDEPADLELVRQIYQHLYPHNPAFGLDDVIRLLATSPELMNLNNQFSRNEGLRRSEQADHEYLGANKESRA